MSKLIVKRALISVYYKDKLLEFAKFLSENNVEIISTGGTYSLLTENNIKCLPVEEFTGMKEFFGGRVKTLHPLIHGGILSKRDSEAKEFGIKEIDLVVVNLYPFENLVSTGESSIDKLIEMIDIGGPTMLRACAKNYKYTCPVCSFDFYDEIINEIKTGGITDETRLKMATEVFNLTSYYDAVITKTLSNGFSFNKYFALPLKKEEELRYGENPHQSAAYYSIPGTLSAKVSDFFTHGKLHGKELSFNNISDTSSIIKMLSDLPDNSCVAVKHSNPCGAAIRKTTHESFLATYEGDNVSIFGGIVGFKGVVKKETAQLMSEIFLEIIIAESFDKDAFEILSKKKNIRLLSYEKWKNDIFSENKFFDTKRALDGFIFQTKDNSLPFNEEFKTATKKSPAKEEIDDLKFAQTMVKHVKSNAIVIVKNKMLLGVGAGQMNRVGSAKIALVQAGKKAKGAVMGSDAYFPMDDTVRVAAEYGVTAIIQPGGSLKDEDSIKACDELGLSMVFTGVRHFYH